MEHPWFETELYSYFRTSVCIVISVLTSLGMQGYAGCTGTFRSPVTKLLVCNCLIESPLQLGADSFVLFKSSGQTEVCCSSWWLGHALTWTWLGGESSWTNLISLCTLSTCDSQAPYMNETDSYRTKNGWRKGSPEWSIKWRRGNLKETDGTT